MMLRSYIPGSYRRQGGWKQQRHYAPSTESTWRIPETKEGLGS